MSDKLGNFFLLSTPIFSFFTPFFLDFGSFFTFLSKSLVSLVPK